MAYKDTEFRRNLWEQFGIGLQSLTEQWRERKMAQEKDIALDNLVAIAEVVCDSLELNRVPSPETLQEFRVAINEAWKVNDYKKGEPI